MCPILKKSGNLFNYPRIKVPIQECQEEKSLEIYLMIPA